MILHFQALYAKQEVEVQEIYKKKLLISFQNQTRNYPEEQEILFDAHLLFCVLLYLFLTIFE